MKAVLPFAACAIVFFALSAIAAEGGPGRTARTSAAMQVLADCGEQDQIAVYFDKLINSQLDAQRASLTALGEEQWRTYEREFRAAVKARSGEYLSLIANVYAADLNDADLAAMLDYCHSPVGQKLARLRVKMERETYAVRDAWFRQVLMTASRDAFAKARTVTGGDGL